MPLARRATSVALTICTLLGTVSVASADVVVNDANGASSEGRHTIVAGGSTTITYTLEVGSNSADDRNGCNARGNDPVVIAVSAPQGVTANPTSVNFTGCGAAASKTVTFSSDQVGAHPISHAVTSGRGVNTVSGADFTLTVKGATTTPANTAPTLDLPSPITAQGNTTGGALVAFTATASDAEDGVNLPADCNPSSGGSFPLGGPHTVTCRYTDRGGLTTSGSFTVTVIDTSAPTLLVPTPAEAEATGPDGATVSWTTAASDIVDPDPQVDCTSDPDSTYELGVTMVTCTATDASGNVATGVFDVTVSDRTAPDLVDLPESFTEEATSPTGALVTYTPPRAVDAVDPEATVNCLPASGTHMEMGATTVTCTATDGSGNHSPAASFTVTVEDTTAPALTVPGAITAEAAGPGGAAVDFTVSALDAVDANPTVRCDAGTGDTFALGQTEVTCTATDEAGNTGEARFTVTVEDTTAPVLTLPRPVTAEATGPDGAAVSFAATATDIVDGTFAAACSPGTGGTFPLGTSVVSCTARDAAGNETSGTFPVLVEDTTAPVLDGVPGDVTVEATGPDGAVVTFAAPTAEDVVDGSVAVICTPGSGGGFPIGTTSVACSATDTAGNQSDPETFQVTVRDTTAPALSGVPRPITAEATGPHGAVVPFDAPTAFDLVEGDRPVACTPPSGSTFGLGSNTVECATSDTRGNTATGQFPVLVVDTTEPALTNVPANLTLEAAGPDGAEVPFTIPTATDLVDGAVPVTCTALPGEVLALGQHTVICTASDAAANMATATFTVDVVDTTAPVVTGAAPVEAEATSADGAGVHFTVPTAEDLVDGPVDVTCDRQPGATFALGTTTVNCSATDESGNTATADFIVVVVDTTGPQLTNLPGTQTAVATTANGAVIQYDLPVAVDLVDGERPVVCAPASGSMFPLGWTSVTCTAADSRGNETPASFAVRVSAPANSGILQPINTTGNRSAFKLNSTIPVKVQLTGVSAGITDAAITVTVRKLSDTTDGATPEMAVTAALTGGSLMRYDATGNQYIYNLGTKPLSPGRWGMVLSMGPETMATAEVVIVR